MRVEVKMLRFKMLGLVAMWLLVSGIAHATEMKGFAGTWAMRLGTRNLFVLRLTPESGGLRGSWDRPMKFSDVNGAFANMRGGVRKDTVSDIRLVDGVLHFVVENANNSKDKDAYAMRVDGDHAELAFDDIPVGVVVEPYRLERVEARAMVASDWETNRLYTLNDSDIANAEMEIIYKEDQRVRMAEKIDWETVNKTDEERRAQTRRLLAAGGLHTGKDYEEAAFVFQHGAKPDDYLLAHTLAMVAVSKGDSTAIWIAAATLDRYLEKIGQKQVFGTQYTSDPQHRVTQEPYDRELVSDALRQQLGVPSQSTQAEQLKAYEQQK